MNTISRIALGIDWTWISIISNIYHATHESYKHPKTIERIRSCHDWIRLSKNPGPYVFTIFLQCVKLFYKLDLNWNEEKLKAYYDEITSNSIKVHNNHHWSNLLSDDSKEVLMRHISIPKNFDYMKTKVNTNLNVEQYTWNLLHYLSLCEYENINNVQYSYLTFKWISNDNIFYFLSCIFCKIHFCQNTLQRERFKDNLMVAFSFVNDEERKRAVFQSTCIFHDDINITIYGRHRDRKTQYYNLFFTEYKTIQEMTSDEIIEHIQLLN